MHLGSWRSTYRGLLADEYLDGMDAASRVHQWRISLSRPDLATFVAENAKGEVVGFSLAGPNRERTPGIAGELYAIYLLESEVGQGTGHALFDAARTWMEEDHLTPFVVWVLKDNARARRFYEREGGELGREKPLEIGGKQYAEVAYRFT